MLGTSSKFYPKFEISTASLPVPFQKIRKLENSIEIWKKNGKNHFMSNIFIKQADGMSDWDRKVIWPETRESDANSGLCTYPLHFNTISSNYSQYSTWNSDMLYIKFHKKICLKFLRKLFIIYLIFSNNFRKTPNFVRIFNKNFFLFTHIYLKFRRYFRQVFLVIFLKFVRFLWNFTQNLEKLYINFILISPNFILNFLRIYIKIPLIFTKFPQRFLSKIYWNFLESFHNFVNVSPDFLIISSTFYKISSIFL